MIFLKGPLEVLTSRQHFPRCFLRFVYFVAAVLFLSLVLRASFFLFKGLQREPVLLIEE